jgi:hypothetical protein
MGIVHPAWLVWGFLTDDESGHLGTTEECTAQHWIPIVVRGSDPGAMQRLVRRGHTLAEKPGRDFLRGSASAKGQEGTHALLNANVSFDQMRKPAVRLTSLPASSNTCITEHVFPSGRPLLGNGCYAETGPLAIL